MTDRWIAIDTDQPQGSQFPPLVKDEFDFLYPGGGGGGSANLSLTMSPTQAAIFSDSGTDIAIPVAAGANAGLISPAEKTKLAGIDVGATANATNAQLRDRTTHTGMTSAASTISDFAEAVRDTVAAFLVQGANVTLTNNDAGDTFTIAAAGGGGGGGFSLTPSASPITTDTVLSVGTFNIIDASGLGSSMELTLPTAPADQSMIAVYLMNVNIVQNISLLRGGSGEFNSNGSGIFSVPLYIAATEQTVVLSTWMYESTGDFWYPINYNQLTTSIDIPDSTPLGRTLLTAATTFEARDAIQVWIPRVATTSTSATPAPDAGSSDFLPVTVGANTTVGAPTGSFVDGQQLTLRLRATGAFSLSWNAIYRAVGVTLPPSIASGKTVYVTMFRNNPDVKWDVFRVAVQA